MKIQIKAIEQQVLEAVQEDLGSPDNWDGTGEVQDYIQDGVDELASSLLTVQREFRVPLRANVNVYSVGDGEDQIIRLKSVFLVGQKRWLRGVGFIKLVKEDNRWIRTTGTPYLVMMLGFKKLLVYPTPSAEGDLLIVTGQVTPRVYDRGQGIIEFGSEYLGLLVKYCVARLYLRTPNRFQQGTVLYGEIMKELGGLGKTGVQLLGMVERGLRSQQDAIS